MTPQQAYRQVRSAIASGVLVRPDRCQKCGKPDTKCADGRSIIQAHHHDYSRPLDVEWICAKCHRAETPLPPKRPVRPEVRGEGNGNAKLTNKQAALIRASSVSSHKLAVEYGVDRAVIRRIKQGKAYAASPAAHKGELDNDDDPMEAGDGSWCHDPDMGAR